MNGKAVPQSDFFALGRTFVYLMTGRQPTDFPENPRTGEGELIWTNSAAQISQPLKDFIDYLIKPFPGNRPQDTFEMLQCLSVIAPDSGSSQQSVPTSQHQSSQSAVPIKYAGFYRRLAAYIIDIIILTIGTALVGKILFSFINILPEYTTNSLGAFGHSLVVASFVTIGGIFGFIFAIFAIVSSLDSQEASAFLMTLLLAMLIKWFYFTLFESSVKQATVGKMILGIIVTDFAGKRLLLAQANGRFWGKAVSALIILIGFIMAGFTKKKQALHDMMAGTLVIKKNS